MIPNFFGITKQLTRIVRVELSSCLFRMYSTSNVHSNLNFYKRIMHHFPGNIEMSFAYGSGVFQQENNLSATENMLDLIFVVNDPIPWHRANIKLNPDHYSFLKWFGSRYITRIQNKYSAQVYFNTLVPCEGRTIKYGVISTNNLITDLLDWNTLYISGRLHKPVLVIQPATNKRLLNALDINLHSAVHAALLLLPEHFDEEAFYLKICSLSYEGDFRMTFGENKDKVKNIVKPNIAQFRKLYEAILSHEQHLHWDRERGCLEQYPNHVTQAHHLNMLPKGVQQNLLTLRMRQGAASDLEEILRSLSHSSFCDDYIQKSLATIVRHSSWSQSVKSFFTAGLFKSIKYSLMKVQKMTAQ